MKETVTKVIDTLTQEDVHEVFQKLLERYKKCIAAGGDYFEGDYSFMCVLSIKVPIGKKSGNLLNDPRTFDILLFSYQLSSPHYYSNPHFTPKFISTVFITYLFFFFIPLSYPIYQSLRSGRMWHTVNF